jgi:hypothetical protein
MTDATSNPDTERAPDTTVRTPSTDRQSPLRWIPPVAALGTAFVLQVILVTDTVGTALADRTPGSDRDWTMYAVALVLGLAVASCVEGGAAYLMDLYDKHLLARDNVLVLRLGMLVYVAGSAAAVHWWTEHRNLPTVVGWLLAGMSASALFLWSRGSRWQHRTEMRNAGQLDPALPRLSVAAKFFHPIRWIVTMYLISWEPVRTTDEARDRYDEWRTARADRKAGRRSAKPASVPDTKTRAPRSTPTVASAETSDTGSTVVPMNGRVRRQRTPDSVSASPPSTNGTPTVQQMADTLTAKHGAKYVGKPAALTTLREVYGSCAADRAIAAKDLHNARHGHGVLATPTPDEQPTDDKEDSPDRPQYAQATA